MSEIVKLKDEGNQLFSLGEYPAASVKYTEALVLDPKNAVLYANRSACGLQMRQFMDAKSDALQAVKIDPTYAKAWARMATACDFLNDCPHSVAAWKKALNALPKENLTAVQLRQKEQFESSLSAAEKKLTEIEPIGSRSNAMGATPDTIALMPWKVAERMIPDLTARQEFNSSAWVIYGAYMDYARGVKKMKTIRSSQVGNVVFTRGETESIVDMTNGILRDPRAFFIDGPEWLDAFHLQLQFDDAQKRLWLEGGPQLVMEEALVRQREEGWDSCRPALAATIRNWIMRGFMDFRVHGKATSGVEYLSRAFEVLNWGRTVWKSVPSTDRGVIFDLTFVRGVHSLYLTALLEVVGSNLSDAAALEDLYDEAQELAREPEPADYTGQTNFDPSFHLSFFKYPQGNALAAKGFYHVALAQRHEKEEDFAQAREQFLTAGRCYREAAMCYPSDDEEHAWFLKCALSYLAPFDLPVGVLLDLMYQIRESVPKVKLIWEQHPSRIKPERDAVYKYIAREESKLRKMVADGAATMEDMVHLQL
ncbi:hypothetical protein C8J56DRAFT_867365 [Mycena floridula]|nr:hypothetical protein C8J56DRAFT_867365 [Mycena floridula]